MKIVAVDEKIRRYKSNWLRHIGRKNSNRMSKIMMNCRANGKRRFGRTLKGLLGEAEKCLSRPNS